MNQAVVTGFSVLSPLGKTHAEFSRGLFAGDSGIVSLAGIVADPAFPVHCAGLLPEGIYPPMAPGDYGGETRALMRGLVENYFSCVSEWQPVDAVIYGTNNGIAKLQDIQNFYKHSGRIHPDNLHAEYGLDSILHRLAEYGQPPLAPQQKIVCANGCITALVAINYARQRIQAGKSKRVLVICDEVRVRAEDLLKYNALGALSRAGGNPREVSRPFSKGRSGFVKGEGAGFIIVEERGEAERRGARVFARLLGFGQTSDAWRLTDGREDLKGMVGAMQQALARARVSPEEIDYINAHGTSTVKNDHLETEGIKKVFGRRAYEIPVSSLKSQIGHLNFACGMVETIACLQMFSEQKIAPTINYEASPDCDLYYVPNKSEDRSVKHILKNSFGFGGANAALVMARG